MARRPTVDLDGRTRTQSTSFIDPQGPRASNAGTFQTSPGNRASGQFGFDIVDLDESPEDAFGFFSNGAGHEYFDSSAQPMVDLSGRDAVPLQTRPSQHKATLRRDTLSADPQAVDRAAVQQRRKGSVLLQQLTDKRGNPTAAANQVDDSGISALHKAARTGDLDALNYLLSIGLNAQARAENGSTPAHDAAASGNVGCLQALLWHEPNLVESTLFKNRIDVLHLACMFGQVQVAAFLIEQGYSDPSHAAHNGSTPLHYAAASGQMECVEYIINSIPPEEVDATNRDGDTALHRAAFEGHSDVVELLLGAGASASLESGGLQPCHIAARKGHLGVIEVLQAHDSRLIISKTEEGASLWHFAAAAGQLELVRWLLQLLRSMPGDDAEEVWSDEKWNTPVHDAAAHGHLEVLRLLHSTGVVLDSENLDDHTPAQIAREMNQAECAIFLTLKTSN
eukprot:m.52406 g.52406  ORF g.52406 m.52406 type:complete len:452 (+) comp13500_c0_seq4:117-1472(+)